MRALSLALFATVACPFIAAVAEEPAPYDFKSIPLGITLEEFRKLPHPDGDARSKPMCTGDKVQFYYEFGERFEVQKFGVEKELGLVKCVFWGKGYRDRPEVTGLNLGGGSYGSSKYGFEFMPDGAGTPRLYEIYVEANLDAADDIVAALTAKYGKPKSIPGTMQTKAGARFDQITHIWANPKSSITMQTRATRIDDMVLLFVHTGLAAQKKALLQSKKDAIPNKI